MCWVRRIRRELTAVAAEGKSWCWWEKRSLCVAAGTRWIGEIAPAAAPGRQLLAAPDVAADAVAPPAAAAVAVAAAGQSCPATGRFAGPGNAAGPKVETGRQPGAETEPEAELSLAQPHGAAEAGVLESAFATAAGKWQRAAAAT